MHSKQIFTAVLAAASAAFAADSDDCTQDTFTINSQADFSSLQSCTTLTGTVQLGTSTDATIDLSGPTAIKGDLKLSNNKVINTLKSSSLKTISGAFSLQNLTTLTTLSFSSLSEVGSISWTSLNAIDTLTFTTGLQKADSVTISDTFLSSLDGLDVASAGTLNINNNRRLVKYESSLGNISTLLNINANGLNLDVSFPNLIWAKEMTISNVSSFSCPSLAIVNGSLRMDSNFFQNFSAPNLTSTTTGDISFVSNAELTNVTMPKLTSIGGGFQIANNTAFETVNGFESLKTVGGAVKFRGNFSEISLSSLNDVKGSFDIVSTADITSSCDTFGKLAPSSQGGNGDIQGKYSCQSNNANANSDTSTSTSTSSSPKSTSTGSGASGIGANGVVVLGLAAVAGAVQLL